MAVELPVMLLLLFPEGGDQATSFGQCTVLLFLTMSCFVVF